MSKAIETLEDPGSFILSLKQVVFCDSLKTVSHFYAFFVLHNRRSYDGKNEIIVQCEKNNSW
jgi:hypothetical protein